MGKFPVSTAFFVLLIACAWRFPVVLNIDGKEAVGYDYWWSKWSVVMAMCSVVIGVRLGKKLRSFFFGAGFAWVCLSAVFVISWRYNFYRDAFDDCHRNAIEANSGLGIVCFLLVFLAVSSLTNKMIESVAEALGSMCLISSILVCVHYARGMMHDFSTGGFFDQGSMEGLFIAFTYPMLAFKPYMPVWERWKLKYQHYFEAVCIFLPPIACAILCGAAHTSQPIIAIAGVISLYIIKNPFDFYWGIKKFKPGRKFIITSCLLVFGLAILVGSYTNHDFFKEAGRFVVYKMNLKWLWERKPIFLVGMGTGVYPSLGPALQKTYLGSTREFFLWVHSDFIQVLMEQGIIGFICLIGCGVQAFLRGWKSDKWWAAISLAGYGAAMVFNYPMHLAVHAFVGMYVLIVCLYD